jgi:alkanesulfonate monooxygenase SsuD/methylene tetrahydromethanopterin reductase-like flavin-dependent oxidoreductase (luciferase family)
MQIGFNLPISGPMSTPESLIRIARQGEALGYDYLTLTDHIVLPNLRVPGYPYSESGEFFGEGPERRYEQLTAAAFIAAKTTRIRLVLAVMVGLTGRPCSLPRCCRRSMSCPAGAS